MLPVSIANFFSKFHFTIPCIFFVHCTDLKSSGSFAIVDFPAICQSRLIQNAIFEFNSFLIVLGSDTCKQTLFNQSLPYSFNAKHTLKKNNCNIIVPPIQTGIITHPFIFPLKLISFWKIIVLE